MQRAKRWSQGIALSSCPTSVPVLLPLPSKSPYLSLPSPGPLDSIPHHTVPAAAIPMHWPARDTDPEGHSVAMPGRSWLCHNSWKPQVWAFACSTQHGTPPTPLHTLKWDRCLHWYIYHTGQNYTQKHTHRSRHSSKEEAMPPHKCTGHYHTGMVLSWCLRWISSETCCR